MNKVKLFFCGTAIGVINSLFGAGGGIIAVPVLRSAGLDQKKAQASAMALILPLSVISMIMYLYKGYFDFADGLRFIPLGFIGAVTGTKIMGRISDKALNVIFSLLLIYSGMRMIFR